MADSKTQMFIGNLPWSIRARHLEDDFAAFGEVTDAFVAYKGRRSRGFGFVTMKNPADATKAQAALDGKQVGEGEHEREMRVTFAKERSKEDQEKADAAKAAATARRADRQKKREAAAESGEVPAGEAAAPAEEGGKGGKKGKKRAPKKKGGKGGGKGGSEAAKEKPKGEKKPAETTFAVPKGPRGKGGKKELTEEEKKARGLLYDTSKASAVREDSEEEDEGEADFAGGDPFEGL